MHRFGKLMISSKKHDHTVKKQHTTHTEEARSTQIDSPKSMRAPDNN